MKDLRSPWKGLDRHYPNVNITITVTIISFFLQCENESILNSNISKSVFFLLEAVKKNDFRSLPNYARKGFKLNFISTVRPTAFY